MVDLRESPSLELIDELIERGGNVSFIDPYFKTIPRTRKHNIELRGGKLNPQTLSSADLVLLATDHDDFDFQLIMDHSSLIVDTRGRLKSAKNVIKA